MTAQGEPVGGNGATGLASLVHWAAVRLGVPGVAAPTLEALMLAGADPAAPRHDFGWEVHHDDSGRVDACAFSPSDRGWQSGGITGQEWSAVEFDILGDQPRLAGVFQSVAAGVPAPLSGWDQPLLLAQMPGRGGTSRLILGVADQLALARHCDALAAAGVSAGLVELLRRAAPLVTSPTTLRLAMQVQPGSGVPSGQVGLEVFLDPSVFDVGPALADLGVTQAQVAEMTTRAEHVPGGQRLALTIPGLPGLALPDVCQGIGFSHFKLAWDGAADRPFAPVLKSYFMVSTGPAASAEQRRDAAVRRAAVTWPERLRWAASQLPLRRPTADELAGLGQWQQEVDPRGTGSAWRVRLERDGLNEDRALVAVSDRVWPLAPEPGWWKWYELIVTAIQSPGQAETAPLPPEAGSAVAFAHLLWPGAVAAWQAFARCHPALAGSLAPPAQQDLQLALLARLSSVATPTLLHVLWEAVPYGQRLLAGLGLGPGSPEGGPPASGRYAQLCSELAADGMSGLLARYPVLGGLLGQVTLAWHDSLVEMLTRLAQDRPSLAAALDIPLSQPVAAVMMAAGDTHNGGRTVAILELAGTKLVYKPRPVALESLYHDVVAGLPHRWLRAARVLERTDPQGSHYGYMGFVTARPAGDPGELAAFYRNAGGTLAVLHALSATDCHHENLIAAGDQLVPIDAETLLSGPGGSVGDSDDTVHARADGGQFEPATVLRIGLLPTWLWLDGQRRAVDISALGISPQWRAGAYHGLLAINTDAMTHGRQDRTRGPSASLPLPAQGTEQLQAHLPLLVHGFTEAYRGLAAGVGTWLGRAVAQGAPTTRRAVLRPTYVYASLLGSSLEPGALASATGRGMVLERLTRAHLDESGRQSWPIVGAEQQALAQLDIPYFEVPLAGGATLWPGGAVPGWPPVNDWSTQAELGRLGPADLDLQVRLIEAAVAVSALRFGPRPDGPPVAPRPDPPSPRAMARACISQVTGAAISVPGAGGEPECAWMGAVMLPDGVRANLERIGVGLYDGRLGLAIALYEWAAAGGAPDDPQAQAARATADAALAPLLRALDGRQALRAAQLATTLGLGMAGVGGLLRGLAHLRIRGHIPAGTARRAELALLDGLQPETIAAGQVVDHISGVAGLIGPLVALADPGVAGSGLTHAGLAELIRCAADSLVAAQDQRSGGWWTLPGDAPLTGLAHGASGIALALARAAVALGEPDYAEAAVRGLDYEASTFSATAGNWPDFRNTGAAEDPAVGRFMMGWCAGAPGIALTRMGMLELLPESPAAPAWRAQLHTAAAATAGAPPLANDHLCCGNLGRVVVLREISRFLADPRWDDAATDIVAEVLTRPGEETPRSVLGPDAARIAMPGLMTGLPGVALALLDPPDPSWVPNLLL